MEITISPCPNDTFSFFHWIHHKHTATNLIVDYQDVQTCNERAIANQGDVIKVSYAVYPLVQRDYIILDAGSALGQGCGPLLIGRQNININQVLKIAVPGKNTTANKLLRLIYKGKAEFIYTTYEQVIPLIEKGEADAGVIIHENRFTYQEHNLCLLIDLGKTWEETFAPLLPLGGILAKRSLGTATIKEISNRISESIAWAFQHKNDPELNRYIVKHAQEIEPKVVHQHIDLYVNAYSIDLGEMGKDAVVGLLKNDLLSETNHFASQL